MNEHVIAEENGLNGLATFIIIMIDTLKLPLKIHSRRVTVTSPQTSLLMSWIMFYFADNQNMHVVKNI